MGAARYYILDENNQPTGPVDIAQLLSRGIQAENLICRVGDDSWKPASEYPELWPTQQEPEDGLTPTAFDPQASESAMQVDQVTPDFSDDPPILRQEPHGIAERQMRAKWAMAAVGFLVLLGPISIWNSQRLISFLREIDQPEYFETDTYNEAEMMEQAEALDAIESGLGILIFMGFILSVVLYLRWFRCMARDLDAHGKLDMTLSSATWSWFVPIISIFRPVQVIRSMIRHSTKAGVAQAVTTVWWVLWIIDNYIANQLFRSDLSVILDDDASISQVIETCQHDIYGQWGTIVTGTLCIATIILVTKASEYWPNIQESR